MRTATLPAVRVSPATRSLIESVLKEGESLSTFIEETMKRHATWRKEDEIFHARAALASKRLAEGGKFYTPEESIARLRAQVQRARDKQAAQQPTTATPKTGIKPPVATQPRRAQRAAA
jgi:hypothetical protein